MCPEGVALWRAGLGRREAQEKMVAKRNYVGGDDAADALRYLVATKSRVVVQRKLRGL